jgi:hypothetical protein
MQCSGLVAKFDGFGSPKAFSLWPCVGFGGGGNSLSVEQHNIMIRRRKCWLVLGLEAANGYPHAFKLWPYSQRFQASFPGP